MNNDIVESVCSLERFQWNPDNDPDLEWSAFLGNKRKSFEVAENQSIKKSKVNSTNTARPIFYENGSEVESNEYTKEKAENNMEAIDRAANPGLYYATIILDLEAGIHL